MEKKLIKEKENMKVQLAAFDKILPGVQAHCAVSNFPLAGALDACGNQKFAWMMQKVCCGGLN